LTTLWAPVSKIPASKFPFAVTAMTLTQVLARWIPFENLEMVPLLMTMRSWAMP